MSRETFENALKNARRRKKPVLALRPDHRYPEEMDDIVVHNCDVHLEAMSDKTWWMACRFANGEEVVFWFGIGKNPKRLVVTVTDQPADYIDWDDLYREHLK